MSTFQPGWIVCRSIEDSGARFELRVATGEAVPPMADTFVGLAAGRKCSVALRVIGSKTGTHRFVQATMIGHWLIATRFRGVARAELPYQSEVSRTAFSTLACLRGGKELKARIIAARRSSSAYK